MDNRKLIEKQIEILFNGNFCADKYDSYCQFLYSEEIHKCYLFGITLNLSEWDKKEQQKHCIRCSECMEATNE